MRPIAARLGRGAPLRGIHGHRPADGERPAVGISGTRARATFPLRIQHADSIEPIRVTLKKRGGTGLQWELSAIE